MGIRGMMMKHPRRTIVLGFILIIFLGGSLLSLPVAVKGEPISFLDGLFTSTSAVCVTGLTVVDTGATFSTFGQMVIALLIQIGGLGITSIGVITILLASGRVSMGGRKLAKEAFNLSSGKGLIDVIKGVLYVTLFFEFAGSILFLFTFLPDFTPLKAVGMSLFHAISSFNNAGFDVMGGGDSIARYSNHGVFLLGTAVLIIMGGIGFFVTREVVAKKSFKAFSLHTKIVISTTLFLIVAGGILIKIGTGIPFGSAFFHSVSARTAGFATENLTGFGQGGILILMVLMFIGASPGSTGGGVKTTTFFVVMQSLKGVALNKHCQGFKRRVPNDVVFKAMNVMLLAFLFIMTSSFLILIIQPTLELEHVLFEVVSGFGTVGLSLGITPELNSINEVILMVTMFCGRLGPITLITLWGRQTLPQASYSEEDITVG